MPIYRKEVYVQIQEANQDSVSADGMAALKDFLA